MEIIRLKTKLLQETLLNPSERDVLLVQGARQVGKTTLIEQALHHLPSVFSVNLERDSAILRAIDRSTGFDEFTQIMAAHFKQTKWDQPGHILFVDEAQESEKLGSYIRFMKEEWQHTRVVLSGSSMTRIFRSTTRVPVGRYRPWLVTPLVFEEFLSASADKELYELFLYFRQDPAKNQITGPWHERFLKCADEYLRVGGMPSVVTTHFKSGDYLAHRHAIYDAQEDDFVRKSSLSERALFSCGLKGVANYIGMPSKYSHIHENKKTAEKILSEETAWNLIIEIEQKSLSSTTQHLPKRYLYDIGMAQDLRDMPFPRLSLVSTRNPALRTQLGGLFENMVLIQLLDAQTYLGNLSGCRVGTSDSSEVDFVLRTDSAAIPIECKATQNVSMKHWSGLKSYLDFTNQSLGFLVSAAPFKVIQSKDKTLINLPLYLANLPNMQLCAERFSN